jgi:spermine oxidase
MNTARKPRIAIVGAGMAGLSAANRLMEAYASSQLDFVVLEASDRVGGRICSTEFHGERVEKGATWIHGIEGSPVYAIAKQIGAMEDREKPWEFMDDFRHNSAVLAEGGLVVPPSLADPMLKLYTCLFAKAQNQMKNSDTILPDDQVGGEPNHGVLTRGLGIYLRAGLEEYLEKNAKNSEALSASPSAVLPELGQEPRQNWDLRSLQEAVFHSRSHMDRTVTAADNLDNVDLDSYCEYWEFPGIHLPIPGGYSSVVQELVNRLPEGSIVYNAKVESIAWGSEVGGSGSAVLLKGPNVDVEVDHVILTVSLGVLKSVIKNCKRNDADSVKDQQPQDLVFHGFRPPLPPRKASAISRLGFGVVDKVLLQMGSGVSKIPNVKLVFAGLKHGDGGDDLIPWWMRKTYAVVRIHKQSRVVTGWFAGKEAIAMESLADQEVIEGFLDTLSAFGMDLKKGSIDSVGEGDKSPVIDGILRSDWGRNPLFWGSYSYVPVGSTGGDIDILTEPLPYPEDQSSIRPLQILFAGEATDRHYYSTTHGAYLSGLREANRLLRHYNLLQSELLK